jgi:murein DD-endopeptidase MepM/ murein hydrolase activator NlpD
MSPVDCEDRAGGGPRTSGWFKACALAAILVLFLGGGWAAVGSGGGIEAGLELELEAIGHRLDPSAIASGEDAAEAADSLVREARRGGLDPSEALARALPQAHQVLGMLSLDRDIDDFLDYANRDDAVGDYYREEARVSLEMRPLRGRYEAAFAAACAALSGKRAELSGKEGAPSPSARPRPYIAAASEVWLPPRRELPLSHPYALDVFFHHVERSGEAEKGPLIRALKGGIVVASARDWSGGQGLSAYRGGGLSPASGNGLVVYDPESRLYCSYFHLSSVLPRTGSLLEAGDAIGRGGNSGMNARKKDHGEHVHLEIFDAAQDEPLSAYQILEILKK